MAGVRVSTPNTMVMLDSEENTSTSMTYPERSSSRETGKLNERTENCSRPSSRCSVGSRVSSFDSGISHRTPTPSKQLFLTSVRRKDDVDYDLDEKPSGTLSQPTRANSFYRDVHDVTSKLNQSSQHGKQQCGKGDSCLDGGSHKPKDRALSSNSDILSLSSSSQESSHLNYRCMGENGVVDQTSKNSDEKDSAADEEEADSCEDTAEKAPSELLMEFLGCVMQQDYINAEKLCKMILIYEPTNPEALKFQPLIQEKLQQDEENDSDSDDDDDDDEEEEEEEEEDDSDSDETNSEDSSSEDDNEKEL